MDWAEYAQQFQDRNATLNYNSMLTKGYVGGRSRKRRRGKRKRTKKMK